RDYLTHLTGDGLLAFTCSSEESLRLISIADQAFHEIGELDLPSHVVVLRADSQETVFIFRKPITADDQSKIRSALERAKAELVYAPGMTGGVIAQFLRDPDPRVSLVSDDRPFFFYTPGRALPL